MARTTGVAGKLPHSKVALPLASHAGAKANAGTHSTRNFGLSFAAESVWVEHALVMAAT